MREDIKNRLEQFCDDIIPNSYQRSKAGLIPIDWLPVKTASEIFTNYTDKSHDGTGIVLSATQDKGILPRNALNIDIKYTEDNLSGYKKVEKGDFIISLRSFQGGIEYSDYQGLVSPAYTVLRNILPISDDYYKNYFKTSNFISRLNATTYGIRDGKQIGYQDFKTIAIHYPPLQEQQKIAGILNHCDKIIELKQKLIEEELNRKKWLMRNLFTPKSNYKKITIGKLAEVCAGATPSTRISKYWGGNIRWMNSGELNLKRVYEVEGRITEQGLLNSGTKLLPKMCVLIGLAGQGKTRGTVAINYVSLCTNQSIAAILPNKQYESEFLFWNLENRYMELRKISSGDGARGGLNLKLIKGLVIYLPSLEEQQQISNVLSATYHKIFLLEQELAQWQLKKKALMQLLLSGLVRVTA